MQGSPDAGRLVVITAGSIQGYVFGSNKRRLNVGASHLTQSTVTWVREAIRDLAPATDPIVIASGLTYVLAPDEDTGRSLIEAVTQRALIEAPGLELWGWLEPADATDRALSARVIDGLRRADACRVSLPSGLGRNPTYPFSAACPVTGRPAAAETVVFGPGTDRTVVHLSPSAARQAQVSHDGIRRIREALGEAASAVPAASELDAELDEDGWLAVVHVDGNGFGQLFAGLGSAGHDDETYRSVVSGLSAALDALAWDCLREAITVVQRDVPWAADSSWILPLIVGGDDLTVLVDAAKARHFVEAYLTAFGRLSRADPSVARATADLGVTASAGIAVVKPTAPFHQAYGVAEELCELVKDTTGGSVCGYELQVVHEAAGRDLADIRRGIALAGARVITVGSPAGVAGAARSSEDLQTALSSLPRLFSSTVRHRLRVSLVDGSFPTMAPTILARMAQSPDPDTRSRVPEARGWLDELAPDLGLLAIDLLDVEGVPA